MMLKISRSQVSTQPSIEGQCQILHQPNPTQPNPWMDPTHDQLWSVTRMFCGLTENDGHENEGPSKIAGHEFVGHKNAMQ